MSSAEPDDPSSRELLQLQSNERPIICPSRGYLYQKGVSEEENGDEDLGQGAKDSQLVQLVKLILLVAFFCSCCAGIIGVAYSVVIPRGSDGAMAPEVSAQKLRTIHDPTAAHKLRLGQLPRSSIPQLRRESTTCVTPNPAQIADATLEQAVAFKPPPACVQRLLLRMNNNTPNRVATAQLRDLFGEAVDAIFVIHYPQLEERKLRLNADFRALGLQEAVTWVTWPLREDIAKMSQEELCCLFDCNTLWFQYATNATKAVGLSHIWVYFQMYRHQLKHAIVMEDDPAFEPDFHLALRPALNSLPPNYFMIFLGSCMGQHACPGSASPVVQEFDILDGNRTNQSGGALYKIFGPGYQARCSNGYLTSLRGAQAMLRHVFQVHTGIYGNSDWLFRSVVDADGYWIEPPLWDQCESGSRAEFGCRGVPWDTQACDPGLCEGACKLPGWTDTEMLQCADICSKAGQPLEGFR